MKVITRERAVLGDGASREATFKVAANATMFRHMVDTLYADKILAIIREIATNAADAHIAGGRPQEPFDVQLPSRLEPHFVVRDRGVGLSEEDVFGIYTTLGESSKTNTDELTGCFGLGSKTPFAYADQFTVVSRQDGVESDYTMYLNAAGAPMVSKVGQRKTTEPNGLEIKLPVKAEDFQSFAEKAADVLSVFRVRPNVTGWHSFAFKEVPSAFQGTDYVIYAAHTGRSRVLMGEVAYPLDGHRLFSGSQYYDVRKVCDWGADFRVPVGACGIALSRDSLKYDDRATKAVAKVANAALADLRDRVKSAIPTAKTLWEARLAARQFRRGIWYNLGIKLPDDATWNGKPVSDLIKLTNHPKVHVRRYRVGWRRRGGGESVQEDTLTEFVAGDAPLYRNDLERGAITRLRHHLLSQPRSVGTPVYDEDRRAAFLIDGPSADVDAFLADTGADAVIAGVSTLPKPPTAPRSTEKTPQGKAKFLRLVPEARVSRLSEAVNLWTPDEPPTEGGVYIVIARYRPEHVEHNMAWPTELQRRANLLSDIVGTPVPIYGVRERDASKLLKTGTWVPFHAYALDTLKNLPDTVRETIRANAVHSYLDYGLRQVDKVVGHPPGSAFGKLGHALCKIVNASKTGTKVSKRQLAVTAACTLASEYGHVLPEHDGAEKKAKALFQRYKALIKDIPVVDRFSPAQVFGDENVVAYIRFMRRRLAKKAVGTTS